MKTGRLKWATLIGAVFAAAVLAGCMGTALTIPTLTDQPVDYSKGRTVEASGCGFQLLLFIPIMTNNRAERAFEALRDEAGNDSYIADVKVRERWTYAFVGTVYCTDLQATAYPKKAAPQAPPAEGIKM